MRDALTDENAQLSFLVAVKKPIAKRYKNLTAYLSELPIAKAFDDELTVNSEPITTNSNSSNDNDNDDDDDEPVKTSRGVMTRSIKTRSLLVEDEEEDENDTPPPPPPPPPTPKSILRSKKTKSAGLKKCPSLPMLTKSQSAPTLHSQSSSSSSSSSASSLTQLPAPLQRRHRRVSFSKDIEKQFKRRLSSSDEIAASEPRRGGLSRSKRGYLSVADVDLGVSVPRGLIRNESSSSCQNSSFPTPPDPYARKKRNRSVGQLEKRLYRVQTQLFAEEMAWNNQQNVLDRLTAENADLQEALEGLDSHEADENERRVHQVCDAIQQLYELECQLDEEATQMKEQMKGLLQEFCRLEHQVCALKAKRKNK